jgi:hypothetical protein
MDGTAHTGFRDRRILELRVIRDAATIGYGVLHDALLLLKEV